MKESLIRGWVGFILVSCLKVSLAAVYTGPNWDGPNETWGPGVVVGGKLELNNQGNTVSGTFTKGSGTFDNNFIIFVDSVSGGFSSTSGFYDATDGWTRSISGTDGSLARATQSFATGFHADYAIALSINPSRGGYLYQLAAGPGSTFGAGKSVGLATANDWVYTFSFSWSDVGQTAGSDNGFRFETAYVNNTGNSYFEALETIGGSRGWGNTITHDNYLVLGVEPVPEMTNAALVIFGGMVVAASAGPRARRYWEQVRQKR
jgi:hypothetical protein